MYNEISDNLDKITIANDGYYQYERLLKALKKGYIKVDERSFEDLLEFAVEFGGLVNFYNLNNVVEGDWAPFFLMDESVVLASIINCDFSDLEIKYRSVEEQTGHSNDTDNKFHLLSELFAKIVYMARKVDLWLKVVKKVSSFEFDLQIEKQIEACVNNGLDVCLMKLRAYDEGAGMSDSLSIIIGLNYDNFTEAWGVYNVQADGGIYRGATINDKINNALPYLNSIFYTFLNEVNLLKKSLQSLYCKSLEKDNHQPDVALYIAFLRLFSYAQSSINSYIGKYRDFYYDDILKQKPQGPIPDNVYLCFEADPKWSYRPVTIEKGTRFTAGDDKNGEEILFSLDKDLFVNSAVIVKQRSIYRQLASLYEVVNIIDPVNPVFSDDKHGVTLTQIFAGNQTLPVKKNQITTLTLGNDTVVLTKDYVNNAAILGFAVASECLEMKCGERTLSFRLFHSDTYASKLDHNLSMLADEIGMDSSEIYKKCLLSAFNVWLSTDSKWVELKTPYTAGLIEDVVKNGTIKKIRKGFQIDFSLPDSAPPLSGFGSVESGDGVASQRKDSEAYSCNPAPELPMVKFYLNNHPLSFKKNEKCLSVQVYPMSILNDFELTRIEIDVTVTGFSNINLRNGTDEFPPDKPFNPFGPEPVKGEYFQIESEELFTKNVTSLDVTINWKDLPANTEGFNEYYKDYVLGMDGKLKKSIFYNEAFKCKFSVIDPGEWQISDTDNMFNMFTDDDSNVYRGSKVVGAPGRKLIPSSGFKLDKIVKAQKKKEQYYNPKKSSIKVELTDPPYGFGSGLFEPNTQYAALVNMEKLMPLPKDSDYLKSKLKEMVEKGETMNNPNPPYSPVIKNISVNYTASDELIFNQPQADGIQFFHLHPFEGYMQINSIKEKPTKEYPCDSCKRPNQPVIDENTHSVASKKGDARSGSEDPEIPPISDVPGKSSCSSCKKTKPDINTREETIVISESIEAEPASPGKNDDNDASNKSESVEKMEQQSISTDKPVMTKSDSACGDPDRIICVYCKKLKQALADLEAAVEASKTTETIAENSEISAVDCGQNKEICLYCQKLKQTIKDMDAAIDEAKNPDDKANVTKVPTIPVYRPVPIKSECVICNHSEQIIDAGKTAVIKPGCSNNGPENPEIPVFVDHDDKSPCSCNHKPMQVITLNESAIVVSKNVDTGSDNPEKPTTDVVPNKTPCGSSEKPYKAITEQDKPIDDSKSVPAGLDNAEIVDSDNIPTNFVSLLPQFDSNGCLMIGFDNVEAPQVLSLLFMFMDSNGNRMNEEPGELTWSYLSGNEWKELEPSNILFDFTNGLQNNGIISFNLPSWKNGTSTIVESCYWWLKASANDNIKSFPEIMNIWINAGTASWLINDETGKRLESALPRSTIKTIPETVKGVLKVEQPYKSFGGKPEENRQDMLIRVGERLSHKDRAIMPKDYERLVLQRFPMIQMVKCLPARTVSNYSDAGNVVVVVVHGPDANGNINPLTPMADNQLLADIELYLGARVPAFIKPQVVNPIYCKIKVKVTVGFVEGQGGGSAAEKLNDDIVNNLSPWFFDPERATNKSSYFLKPGISDFIQNRSYVNFITSLTLSYDPKPINDPNAWLFYTSAEKHDITIIYDNPCV